jgi:hypothetical protein
MEVDFLKGQRQNVPFLAVCEATSVSCSSKTEVEGFVFVLGHKSSHDLDSRTYSTDISYEFFLLSLLIPWHKVIQNNCENVMSPFIVIECTVY